MTEKEAQASDLWCKYAKKEQIYLKEHNFTGGYVCLTNLQKNRHRNVRLFFIYEYFE